jgi:polyhydroxyalkanoate synthesis regulator phasin
MAAKAHEISLEAGSKMAAAMKEVIGAAAGLSAFAIESARDLVQYMVRRGQMTQDEADKLIREAEDAWSKKFKGKIPAAKSATAKASSAKSSAKPAAKSAAKKPAKKPAAKKPAAKKPAPKK